MVTIPFHLRLRFATFANLDPVIKRVLITGQLTPAVAFTLALYAERCEAGGHGYQWAARVAHNGRRAREVESIARGALA